MPVRENLQRALLWLLENKEAKVTYPMAAVSSKFGLAEAERELIGKALAEERGSYRVKVGGPWFKACTV